MLLKLNLLFQFAHSHLGELFHLLYELGLVVVVLPQFACFESLQLVLLQQLLILVLQRYLMLSCLVYLVLQRLYLLLLFRVLLLLLINLLSHLVDLSLQLSFVGKLVHYFGLDDSCCFN